MTWYIDHFKLLTRTDKLSSLCFILFFFTFYLWFWDLFHLFWSIYSLFSGTVERFSPVKYLTDIIKNSTGVMGHPKITPQMLCIKQPNVNVCSRSGAPAENIWKGQLWLKQHCVMPCCMLCNWYTPKNRMLSYQYEAFIAVSLWRGTQSHGVKSGLAWELAADELGTVQTGPMRELSGLQTHTVGKKCLGPVAPPV